MTTPQILIVGAGIFGTSTAYHLIHTKNHNPANITILDRAAAPSEKAASTDLNKIVRADYTNPFYMELAYEAMDAWKSYPFLQDAGVYHQTGWIAMCEKGSDWAERIRENFRKSSRGDVTVDMSEGEVRESWGGVLRNANCEGMGSYYFNSSVAWADAGRAVEVIAGEVVRLGGRYVVGEVGRVLLDEDASGVKGVETRDGRVITADKVLLSTGAWTSQLLSPVEDQLNLSYEKRVESQINAAGTVVAAIQLSAEEKAVYDKLPVFIYGEQGEVWPPTAPGMLKFTNSVHITNTTTTDTGHKITVPPTGSQLSVPQELKDISISSIRDRIPQVLDNDRQVDYFRLCWDSVSKDQHPLITRHPDARLQNLYLAAGGSFHSWKFLPIIGRYVANVVDGVSNGEVKDRVWSWREPAGGDSGEVDPIKELREYE